MVITLLIVTSGLIIGLNNVVTNPAPVKTQLIQLQPASETLASISDSYILTEPLPSLTRGPRLDEIEYNDEPANATRIFSHPVDLKGEINPKTDQDWYKVKLSVRSDGVDNLSIRFPPSSINPNPLTGDTNHYLYISIYGAFDINQDNKINLDTELFFMNMTRYRIGLTTTSALFINSYSNEYYYIKFETDGGLANYHYRLNYNSYSFGESNQYIKYAHALTTPATERVEMDSDTYDWFVKKKTIIPSDAVGLNFSVTVEFKNSGSKSAVTLKDGTTVYFVTVLHMLVYHEGNVISNEPEFPWQFRDHIRLSRHGYTKLQKEIEYSDVITLPTELFKWTYVGFFVESYAINPAFPETKLYPAIPEMVEYASETFCEYKLDDCEVEPVKRPELSAVSVISTTTRKIFGRTYDDYIYTVRYAQEDNNPPISTQISIFGPQGEIRESMTFYKREIGVDDIYRDYYKIIFSGLLLGEGDNHVFQFHFKDRNAYANGTIEVGKSWHGPFISNNIRPYVRPSAPSTLKLNEDDETTYFDLNNIFEDADLKEELNFTLADPAGGLKDRVWTKSYSDSILDIEIVNETRLKIDLKPNANGDVLILLNVTDKKHYYLDPPFEFTINVLPVNDPPQIIQYFSHIIMYEDIVNSKITLYEHFVDLVDNQALTFRVENNQFINVTIDSASNVRLTPAPNWYGTEYIDFFASDGVSEVMDFLKVIVRPVNDVPNLPVSPIIELWEDDWWNFTINASDAGDNESVLISHNLTHIFPELALRPSRFGYTFDNVTGYLTLKITNSMVGEFSWNISAVDVNNELNFTLVTLIINNINDPPVPTISYPEPGDRFLTTDKISFRGDGYDPDSVLVDSSFIWYLQTPTGISKLGTGRQLQPQLYENGTHSILLSVHDEEFLINTSITIHVFSINQDLDSDGDGIPDYWENLYDFNIHDPHDAEDDPDADTFSNWEEYKGDTDPFDPNSMPEKHISKEKAADQGEVSLTYGLGILVVLILGIIILLFIIRSRVKKRKAAADKEGAPGSTDGIIGMTPGAGFGTGKFKTPKVVCHVCGKSMTVMTLNRPVVITCTDCGNRGAFY